MAEGTQSPEEFTGQPPRREQPPVLSPEPEEPSIIPSEPTPEPPVEPPHAPPPVTTPIEDVRYSTTFANRQMEIRKRAETLAERAIQEEQRRGAWFNPLTWARKVRMRIFEEYYRQQYVRRAEDTMVENNNSYLELDVVRNAMRNVNANVDQERQSGASKLAELREAGTTQAEILRGGHEEIREATGDLKALLMTNIIRPIVNGDLTDYAQVQERLRQFVQDNPDNVDIRELFGADANRYGEAARYFATDILELGQIIRTDLEAHRFALEELDSRVTINLANADWAAGSQTRFTLADRLIARAQQGRITGLTGNPAFVGAVTSIGVYGAMRAVGYSGQATQFIVPGSGVLTGALFAGLRRNYDLKVDRVSDQRERAYNFEARPGTPRRETLRRYNYDIASVDELLDGGRERFDLGNLNSRGIRELISSDLTQEANREALNRRIAEIRTRLDFGGAQSVDLITFRGEHEVQQGRLELIQAIAEANIALRHSGMTQDEITSTQTRLAGEWNAHFTQDRQQQDRAFAMYRYRNAAGAAIFGGVAGFAGGLAAREVLEFASSAAGIDIGGAGLARDGGAQNRFRDLHEGGGQTRVGELDISVRPDNAVTISEGGQTIVDGGWKITENGVLQARLDSVPDGVLDQFKDKGFEIRSGPEVVDNLIKESHGSIPSNLAGQEVLTSPGTEWITDDQGNFDLIVSGNPDKILLNDASIGPDGKVNFDSSGSILNESNIHSEVVRTEVFGPDGEWTKHATNVDHREWYSYDQPESQRNELRFYTFKDGQTVTLDMTNMELGYQQGLNPNPIAVQEVIKNHEAGWYFTTSNAQQDGLFISDGADGVWDGKLRLDLNANPNLRIDPADPNSMRLAEASKIILNEEVLQKYPDGDIATELYARQDVFNLGQDGKYGFIEAGRMQARPEGNVLQSFATIRGLGPVPESIETTVFRFDTPPVIDRVPTVEIVPPPGTREIPIIPFPWSPRHPLEEMLFLYGYGGEYSRGNLGWIDRDEYKNRRSRTLNENPHAKLDETKEITDYLSRLDPEYREELERMNQSIGTPMNPETRTAITVPTFGEGKIIRKTLEQFLNQKDKNGNILNPNLFEIIVYENDTETRPKDETEEEVTKFKAEHPALKIHYAYKRWTQDDIDKGINTVGNGRKYLCDLAVLRSSKRPVKFGELIIINNDADLEGIYPKYVSDIIEEFDEKEYLDTVVGKRNLPDWALKKPNVRAGQRMWEIFDSVMRQGAGRGISADEREKGWPGLIGENSAMKASIYAAVGGYVPTAKLAEDIHLGDMIRVARNYDDRRFEYLNRLETTKNPRRYLAAVASGVPVYHMYGDYHENKDLRNLDNQALLNMIPDTFDVQRFQKDIDAIWQAKYGSFQHLGHKFDQIFDRAMGFMGVEYKVEGDHVIITNAQKIINNLSKPTTANPRTSSGNPLSGAERLRQARERMDKTINRLQRRVGVGLTPEERAAQQEALARRLIDPAGRELVKDL